MGGSEMKVGQLIKELSNMPEDAEMLLFTNYGNENEDVHEVTGIRHLPEDLDGLDLVRILYKE